MNSQNISVISKPKPTISITQKGDTIVSFLIKDAKIILNDLLDYRIADSLITEYKKRDSLQTREINLNLKDIKALRLLSDNKDKQIIDLYDIILNRDKEIAINEEIIKNQKKEIRKQKVLKIIAMTAAVVFPVLTLLATLR